MALHQCHLFRGRRPADHLARSAELIRCSVGPLSCTRRLRVGREYRVLLMASGPRFVCKDIGSGAVAEVGNVFHDRGFADVFLRHLMQTGGRMHMSMNRLQCDIQLQGCQQGHLLLEHLKTMLPMAEDIVRSPDVSAWKSALCDGLRSADGFHVLRRGDALDPGGSQQDHVDQNSCVLTARTLQGAVLDLAVLPDDRVGVPWVVADNERITGAPRRPVVVVSVQGVALDKCHLPLKCETVASHHCSAGSRLRRLVSKLNMSFPSEVRPDVDALAFEANGSGSSPVTRCSSMTICVSRHCPGSTWTPQSPA